MEKISIPVIDSAGSVHDALQLLKDQNAGAVLVSGAAPKLLDLDIILHALNRFPEIEIGSVTSRFQLVDLRGAFGEEIAFDDRTARYQVQKDLDERHASVGFTGIAGNTATIITRWESLANALRHSAIIYVCESDHYSTSEDLEQPGNKCPDCQRDTRVA